MWMPKAAPIFAKTTVKGRNSGAFEAIGSNIEPRTLQQLFTRRIAMKENATLVCVMAALVGCSGSSVAVDSASSPAIDGQPGTTDGGGGSGSGLNRITSIPVVPSCTLPRDPTDDRPATVDIQRGIKWATLGGQDIALDIAKPLAPTTTKLPLVVVIHGGAWQTGSRSQMTPFITMLASLGYAAAAIDYRVKQASNDNYFPAPISDVRCAVRWLKTHAAEYGLDPDKFIALGTSAGGHLASMLGVAANAAGLDDGTCPVVGQSPSVGAVISLFGPQDMNTEAQKALVIRAADLADPAKMDLYSSIPQATATTVPFLLAHGTVDTSVNPSHSARLKARLDELGTVSTYIPVDGVGHGFPAIVDDVGAARAINANVIPVTCTQLAMLKALTQ
jgi:acetyl esterase/lipase